MSCQGFFNLPEHHQNPPNIPLRPDTSDSDTDQCFEQPFYQDQDFPHQSSSNISLITLHAAESNPSKVNLLNVTPVSSQENIAAMEEKPKGKPYIYTYSQEELFSLRKFGFTRYELYDRLDNLCRLAERNDNRNPEVI